MPSFLIAQFSDFAAGEYGTLSPLSAPANSFTGNNVMRFLDGSIGPRPGVAALTPASVPSPEVVTGIGSVSPSSSDAPARILYTTPTTPALRGFDYPNGTDSALGSTGSVVLPTQIVSFGAKAYAAVPGDSIYEWNELASTFANLTAAPDGVRTVAIYDPGDGFRLIAVQDLVGGASPNRVSYSAPGDPTTWTIAPGGAGTFDVGSPATSVVYVVEVLNRLALANNADEWWTLTGTPGVNDVLRRAPRAGLSPSTANAVARLGESVWFLPDDDDFPVQFTGTVANGLHFRYLSFTGGLGTASTRSAAALPGFNSAVIGDSTTKRALALVNGAWTYHTLGITPSFLTPLAEAGLGVNGNPLIICDASAPGPKFYQWAPFLDRPGKVSDTLAQPGDASTTPLDASFSTAVFHSSFVRRGKQFFPGTNKLEVAINFNKWNTGASLTNHIGLQVRALFRRDNNYVDSEVKEWSEAPSATKADKTPHRAVLRFGDQGEADAYQLIFTGLRGVSIANAQIMRDAD